MNATAKPHNYPFGSPHYTLWRLTFTKQKVGNPTDSCHKEPLYKSHTIRSHRIRNARDGVSKTNTILVNFHVSPASLTFDSGNIDAGFIDPLPLTGTTRGILILRPLKGGGLVITDLCGLP